MTTATDLSPYLALGHTEQEAALLARHDEGETLHPFTERAADGMCQACGDTEDALMHSGVWRNVEPLLDAEPDLRPATEAETADYLAGHLAVPGAVETPEGLLFPAGETSTCLHCERAITLSPSGRWIDPEATGDDSTWSEACEAHDTFTAEHEPKPVVERSQRSYDPTLDTARVDETSVRALVGIGVPLKGVGTILLQGRFLPGGRGSYGAVYVLCEQANGRGFSTNQAIVRAEDGQPITVFAEAGHYDMTRERAEADLATR